jgi:hypothetical protein
VAAELACSDKTTCSSLHLLTIFTNTHLQELDDMPVRHEAGHAAVFYHESAVVKQLDHLLHHASFDHVVKQTRWR